MTRLIKNVFISAVIGFMINGCLFGLFKPKESPELEVTDKMVGLDTVISTGSVKEADSIVELFAPIPDRNEDGTFSGKTGDTVIAVQAVVSENGKRLGYIIRSRSFGYWNDELEYKWNLFYLKTRFFFREKFPQQLDTIQDVQDLYAQINLNDRYTVYIDSSEAEEFSRMLLTTTRPGAIGIVLTSSSEGDTLIIKHVASGSPAEFSGLEKGMKILEVNDTSVVGDSSLLLFNRLTEGDSGTPLELTVLDGKEQVTFSLVKDVVDFPSVYTDTLDSYAHLQIFSFTPSTYDGKSTSIEFREALRATENFPVTLLDLRDNPGGSVSQVLDMCNEIIPEGIIIREEIRGLNSDSIPRYVSRIYYAHSGGAGEGRQFILLADSNSASASEIFISALMEAEGIPMVGEITFGKGIGQILEYTPAQGITKVTSTLYKTRKNQIYHEKGIEPSHTASEPDILVSALELAREMEGRPLAKGAEKKNLNYEIALSELNRRERIRHEIEDLVIDPEDFE
jgi:C-terminal peptidase prc